jgi:4-amino-4-deoxy-L-arabinose transferase-like glycosyltransferase
MFERLTSIPANFIASDGKHLHFRAYAFLFLLCFAFFIPGIATLPPIDRDEPSFAQASKQMVETGNYVDIRVQEVPRYKKPIGIYWLQAASVKLFNPEHLNEIWAYRFPSFISATVAVLMTAALGGLLFTPMTGLLAALMMAGCLILNTEARLAKTDATLLASIMVMQYGLARTYILKNKTGIGTLFLFWTALGVGILIKGPIIVLVLFSTLLWLRWEKKKLTSVSALKLILGILYMLLITLPWFVAILTASHGQFLAQSAGHDLFAKLWQGQDRGKLPPGLHLLAFPGVFFPFAIFAMMAVPDAWQNRAKPAVRFCLGWIIPTWIVFELSLTKLPHYVMPTYPAIAMLTAKAMLDHYPALIKNHFRWLPRLAIGLWLLIGLVLAVGASILPIFLDNTISLWQITASIVLLTVQGGALFLLFKKKPINAIVLMTIGSLIFMTTLLGHTLPNIQNLWMSRQIMQVANTIKPCDEVKIVSSSYDEPSLVFLAGTDTNLAMLGDNASAFMLHDKCRIAIIDNDRLRPFLEGFKDAPQQPYPAATLRSYNLGQGQWRELTFYLMRPDTRPAPKYP